MVGNVAHMNRAQPCPPPQAGGPAVRRCYQHPLCDSAALRCPGFSDRFRAGGSSTVDPHRSPSIFCPADSFLVLLETFIAPQDAGLVCYHSAIIPVFVCSHFSGVVPEELFPRRQILVDRIKMQSPPFAGSNGFFQFFSLSASPQDKPGTLGLLFLGFINNVQDRLTDVRILVRTQASIKINGDCFLNSQFLPIVAPLPAQFLQKFYFFSCYL